MQAANDPRTSLDYVSVEDLNEALRTIRRMLLEMLALVVLAPIVLVGLSKLGTAISPPYGLYILGWDLVTWGLLLTLALLLGGMWWRGRQVGRLLNDPGIQAAPLMSLLSTPGVLAERAKALGMEWSGFYGPLRPRRK